VLAATQLHPRDHRLWLGGRVGAVRACSTALVQGPWKTSVPKYFRHPRFRREGAKGRHHDQKHSLQVVQCPPLGDGDLVKDVQVARDSAAEPTREVRIDC
jgi:hypothetical protein